MRRFLNKLSRLLGRKRFQSELDEEMAFHRAQAEKEFLAEGKTAEEARYAAMRQFGNAMRLREESQRVVEFRLETVAQDVRFALRQMRKNPGFAVTAVLILALGMGVSVAIFGFVDAALVRPLPFARPDRLVAVDERGAMYPRSNLSRADYEDWKRLNHSFESLEVYSGTGFLLRMGAGTEPVTGARVSDGFFTTLGIKPVLGRLFLPGEDQPHGAKIVMLSYGTWQTRFGARRDVIGQSVTLNGESYTIVGVLPQEAAYSPRGSREMWVPLLDKTDCESRRSCHNLDGIARLRDGVTVQAALGDMTAIAARLEQLYPGSNKGQGASVLPLAEVVVGTVRPILLTLLAGAGLLLLIACLNVASLLLVRSESRRREVAVRGALGATPARLTRQFATEGLLLAAAGTGAGLAVGAEIMVVLKKLVPSHKNEQMPFLEGAGLHGHSVWFAAGIALLAALLLAATPALRLSFLQIQTGLAEGSRGSAGQLWRRMGANLVVVELAVAVVLLTGAGLLGKSLYKLLHVDLGFDSSHLATVSVMAPENVYTKDAQKVALYREINRRLATLPGVESVGITSDLPVQCNCDTDWIRIVGKPFHGEHNEVNERDVSPGYLTALGAKLVRGRWFNESDDASHPQVIVINESLAKKYFSGEDPIGRKVGNGDLEAKSMREIVGVVKDIREAGLDNDQWPAEYESIYYQPGNEFSVAVHTTQDEKASLPLIVNTLKAIDPNLGFHDVRTMQEQVDSTQAAILHRFSTWLVGGFAAMALVLGVVGLYGVIAYSVSQRTREIGVRMALGAQRSSVYSLVMKQAGWLTALGVGVGLVCSVGTSMLMRKLLFGVEAWDVPTLAAVAVVLGMAALMASFVPARRAASVNPTEALRAE
jgi:predicted permease